LAMTIRTASLPVRSTRTSTPLRALVILLASNQPEVVSRRLTGQSAFLTIRAQLYGPTAVEGIDRAATFRHIAAVANLVPTFVVERPDDLASVGRVVDQILAVSP